MTRVIVTDEQGHAKAIKAERLEIVLAHGRQLILDFPPLAWGDLSIEAQSEEGHPIVSVQPGACNLLTLRVDVHYDLAALDVGADALALPSERESYPWPIFSVDIQKALKGQDKTWPLPRKRQLRQWLKAVLHAQNWRHQACVTVRFVGKKEGRALNHDFRGKEAPTNILSFAYPDPHPHEKVPVLRGDLVLCVPVIAQEAQDQGKDPMAHYAHLLVHGMLHLMGFDHEEAGRAHEMEARETAILASLGFSDPYCLQNETQTP